MLETNNPRVAFTFEVFSAEEAYKWIAKLSELGFTIRENYTFIEKWKFFNVDTQTKIFDVCNMLSRYKIISQAEAEQILEKQFNPISTIFYPSVAGSQELYNALEKAIYSKAKFLNGLCGLLLLDHCTVYYREKMLYVKPNTPALSDYNRDLLEGETLKTVKLNNFLAEIRKDYPKYFEEEKKSELIDEIILGVEGGGDLVEALRHFNGINRFNYDGRSIDLIYFVKDGVLDTRRAKAFKEYSFGKVVSIHEFLEHNSTYFDKEVLDTFNIMPSEKQKTSMNTNESSIVYTCGGYLLIGLLRHLNKEYNKSLLEGKSELAGYYFTGNQLKCEDKHTLEKLKLKHVDIKSFARHYAEYFDSKFLTSFLGDSNPVDYPDNIAEVRNSNDTASFSSNDLSLKPLINF